MKGTKELLREGKAHVYTSFSCYFSYIYTHCVVLSLTQVVNKRQTLKMNLIKLWINLRISLGTDQVKEDRHEVIYQFWWLTMMTQQTRCLCFSLMNLKLE